MKKITVKKLIEFRKKTDRTKITFINKFKKVVVKSNDVKSSGGDYWISCLSSIRNVFKNDNKDLLDEKINLLNIKISLSEINRIKNQFKRNIDILNNLKEFDFKILKPNTNLTFLKQLKKDSILEIGNIPIEAKPCNIFTFSIDDKFQIGGIWFVAQLEGFNKNELAMFTDILYRYLKKHYSKDFYVNPAYCSAVDLFNGQSLNYFDIQNDSFPLLIDSTIDEINNL